MKEIDGYRWGKWRPFRKSAKRAAMCAACLILSASAVAKKTEKRTSYGTGVQTGLKIVKYHNTCVLFQTFFISGDFFLGLRGVETPTGKLFKKKKELFRTFPESIIIDVEADALPCESFDQPHLPPLAPAVGLLDTLSFGVNWTNNVSNVDLGAVAPIKVEHPAYGNRWDYFLKIRAKDIPLTADLIINVTSRNHIHLATFSAHL